jgi:hypothetical protein
MTKTDKLKELAKMSKEAEKLKQLMQAVLAGDTPNITTLKLKEEQDAKKQKST